MIVWLEDQKVRHYKIEDRAGLRDIASSDWPKALDTVSFITYSLQRNFINNFH